MRCFLFGATLVSLASAAFAHFPFIVPDPNGAGARLVMSETLEPDPQVGIEILSSAKLMLRDASGVETPIALEKREEWMSLALTGVGTRVVRGVVDLGVRTRGQTHVLVYYPKTIVGDAFAPSTVLGETVPIELRPLRADGGFRLELVIGGKPGQQCEVRLIDVDGANTELLTDEEGRSAVIAGAGRYAAWARHWIDQPGERDGQNYSQIRNYATLVFDVASQPKVAVTEALIHPVTPRRPLPEAASSFGAVESDGWLYVYGGHITDRHEYSTASISGRFHRMKLRTQGEWEELAGGPHVQGLNIAAHGGKIYRVGGMEPRNALDQPSDCISIAAAACFDPATGKWSDLPPLPRPRSSHDVLVVGDELYVVGGWCMKGKGTEPDWIDTLDVLDLDAVDHGWRSIPQPFTRRALICAAAGRSIYVIGGFDPDDMPQKDVDVYDIATKQWSNAAQIPGKSRNGFGPAACTHDGELYLSVGTGEMFRLTKDLSAWELFAQTSPRIVHRLISLEREILVVGGAAERTMVPLIESVEVRPADPEKER